MDAICEKRSKDNTAVEEIWEKLFADSLQRHV